MFLVTDLTDARNITTQSNDIKDVGDIIIGITGDPDAGSGIQAIAGHMQFGDEFVSRSRFKVCCVKENEFDGVGVGSSADEGKHMGVKQLLDALVDMLPKGCDASKGHGYWANGGEILCPSEDACEASANFLQDLLQESGITVLTGRYDPEEDARNGEYDGCTGFSYISFE